MTPFRDIKCVWLLYRFFRKEKPDIVHSHTPKAGLLSMLAAKWAGVKIRIHTVAGLRYVTTKGLARRILVFMEKLTGRTATHVWPNSFSMKKFIEKNKLMKAAKLEVIGFGSSNGIDLQRYSSSSINIEKLEGIKSRINYSGDLIYFLSVGRIVHDKGMDELLNAFVRLYQENKQLRLLLVGDFEDEVDPVSKQTRHLIQSHPGVVMTGWSDAVEYYMHFSYALVHPSHREGFPNVLLQAGAMNCPIICSDIDGNIDIVEDGKTGLIFEVKDVESLLEKLYFALDNYSLLQGHAAALRKNIEEHFDQPVVHHFLQERYLQLLGK
jgi:glycosyltransferase involved in cell wall biosynthesis